MAGWAGSRGVRRVLLRSSKLERSGGAGTPLPTRRRFVHEAPAEDVQCPQRAYRRIYRQGSQIVPNLGPFLQVLADLRKPDEHSVPILTPFHRHNANGVAEFEVATPDIFVVQREKVWSFTVQNLGKLRQLNLVLRLLVQDAVQLGDRFKGVIIGFLQSAPQSGVGEAPVDFRQYPQ